MNDHNENHPEASPVEMSVIVPVTSPALPLKYARKKTKSLKPGPTRSINKLTPSQRETLVHWLFEEGLSYREVEERSEKEFEVRIHRNSAAQFYNEKQRDRNVERILASAENARALLDAAGKDSETMYQALLAVLGRIIFEAALNTKDGKPPDLRLVFDGFPLLLEARADAREEKRCALEREQWEFDVVRMCHNHFTELQTIIGNQTMDEPSRLDAIRRRLFGTNLIENH